jgi:hypothetical protein
MSLFVVPFVFVFWIGSAEFFCQMQPFNKKKCRVKERGGNFLLSQATAKVTSKL